MLSTKQVMLDRLTQDRSMLFHSIAFMPDEELVTRPVIGEWSVKDILGHIAAWEAETVRGLEQFGRAERPNIVDINDIDAWNAEQARQRWDAPLADVKSELINVRRQLLSLVSGLPDELFVKAGPPPSSDRPFVVAELVMCAEHDREHAAAIMELKNRWIAGRQITPSALS